EARLDLTVNFDRLVPAALAAAHPTLTGLADMDLPLTGYVDVIVGADGALGDIVFDFAGGPGGLALPLPIAPEALRSIVDLRVSGRLDGALTTLSLDTLAADFGGPRIAMAGEFSGDWSAPDTKAEIRLANVPMDSIGRYWPASVTPNGREWVVERMSCGTVEEMTITLDLGTADWPGENLRPEAVVGVFRVSGTNVAYMPGMPPVVGMDGTGRFDPRGLTAEVLAGSAGPFAIHGAHVIIDAERDVVGVAEVDVSFSGGLAGALAALDQPPFGYAHTIGLDPADIAGEVQGELFLSLPLLNDPPLSSMEIGLGADLFDLAVPGHAMGDLVEGGLRNGQAALLLDRAGFDLSGEGLLAGTPVEFHWRENFSQATASVKRRLDVSGTIDDAARIRAGLADPAIRGPLAVELRLVEEGEGELTGELDIDGKAAELSLPELDWHKPVGGQAEARFALAWEDGALRRLTQFGLLADGLAAAGSAERDPSGVWTVGFDRLAAGLTDIRGSVRLETDGQLIVGVSGSSLDLRPLMAHVQDAPDVTGVAPIDLNAAVDLVVAGDDILLHQVNAKAEYDGRRLTQASLDFAFGEARDLSLRLASTGAYKRVAVLTSANAGAVVAALGLTGNMVGGAMQIEALVDDSRADAPITGAFEIDDFHIVDAPVLARILSAVSITGALEMLGGDGMPFDRLNAPFSYDGSVVRFEDARAYGLSFGITMEGDVDLDRDMADLKGTIVPAYILNSALGNIPVIGDVLTGGEGKGVFAATYAVKGPREAPEVTVNPLAALAPGILRELLGGFEPGEGGDTDPTDSRLVR
ncbi:MAG: AsmA-like C-terminal region-containing protein, partial [Alphaproteobacteria bacterium]|nr:AsmA-like C-terminal region-containing protein [Alphaproteobacteria bacterium]